MIKIKIGISLILLAFAYTSSIPTLNAQADIVTRSELKSKIDTELLDPANRISGQAVVLIYSDTAWSGSILDSSYDSATRDGNGDSKIFIQCDKFGIYSLAIQKQTESGYLFVLVIQDGSIMDSQSTSAGYGVVSIAGNCL